MYLRFASDTLLSFSSISNERRIAELGGPMATAGTEEAGSGSGPKVPPLRIVISRSGSGAVSEEEESNAGVAAEVESKAGSETSASTRLTRSRIRQGEGALVEPTPAAEAPADLNHPHRRKQLKGTAASARSGGLLEGGTGTGGGGGGHWSSGGNSASTLLARGSLEAQRDLRRVLEERWMEDRRTDGAYQPPAHLDQFLLVKKTYIREGNPGNIVPANPPASLGNGELTGLFERQEAARVQLRRAQRVERERLILACEKEVLRVHTRASYAHPLLPPVSAVRILKDADVANPLELDKPLPPRGTPTPRSADGALFIKSPFN